MDLSEYILKQVDLEQGKKKKRCTRCKVVDSFAGNRFVCFMLIMMIGTQWKCNNSVPAKGSVRELREKKIFTMGTALFSELETRVICYLN